jgi:hypothetical protein
MAFQGLMWKTCYTESSHIYWIETKLNPLHRMSAGSVTVSCTPWNCQFTKFSLLCDLCYIGYEPQWMQGVYLLHVHLLSRMEPLSVKLFMYLSIVQTCMALPVVAVFCICMIRNVRSNYQITYTLYNKWYRI